MIIHIFIIFNARTLNKPFGILFAEISLLGFFDVSEQNYQVYLLNRAELS